MGLPQCGIIRRSKKLITVAAEAETATTTLFGKLVSALQTDIAVANGAVTGTLKYVTGYTGFSGEVSEQSGNYLALKFSGNWESATCGYNGHTATLDSDKNLVVRVSDKTKPLTITGTRQGNTETLTLDLSGLTLEEE